MVLAFTIRLSDVRVSSFERLIVRELAWPGPSFFVATRDDGNFQDTYERHPVLRPQAAGRKKRLQEAPMTFRRC
jgi:hypothetical protein